MLEPVVLLSGTTLGAVANRPEIVTILRRMMTAAVANALGIVLLQPMEKHIALTRAARELRMSRLQDPTRGRPLEIDGLACSIAEMR
jgi:ketopantoate reductase